VAVVLVAVVLASFPLMGYETREAMELLILPQLKELKEFRKFQHNK
jgi:hypothetical protein